MRLHIRGCTPETIRLKQSDAQEIKRLLGDGRTEQRVVRRGRVLLAMKSSKTLVSDLCEQVSMTRFGIWALCRRYETTGLSLMYDAPRSGRPREISALQRVAVEQPACCNPSGLGLEMTHWSTQSLASIAMKRGLLPHIARSTVSLILRGADLQPHRSRYWITPTLNANFLQRAGRVLWLIMKGSRHYGRMTRSFWFGMRNPTCKRWNGRIPRNLCVLVKSNARSLNIFGIRYLQHGNWTSRQHLIEHLRASTPEYNRLWAHPINWSWTRHDMHKWAEKKLS